MNFEGVSNGSVTGSRLVQWEAIATLGYTVFAVDVFGKNVRPKTPDEAWANSAQYYKDRGMLRECLKAGLAQGIPSPHFVRHPVLNSQASSNVLANSGNNGLSANSRNEGSAAINENARARPTEAFGIFLSVFRAKN